MGFEWNNFIFSIDSAMKYMNVTIKLTFITFVFSFIFALMIGTIRYYKIPVISQILLVFVTIYLGLPLMVSLVIYNLLFLTSYQSFATYLHIEIPITEIDPIYIAYFAMIMAYSCMMSETVRGAFAGIDKVQYEAGYSVGLTKFQTFREIIFPQMIPIMIPSLINFLIGTLKGSNLVSAIGVTELMVAALMPCQKTYSYLEGYVAAALLYWLVGILIELSCACIEKKSGRHRKKVVAET